MVDPVLMGPVIFVLHGPPAVLGIDAAKGHGGGIVVFPEKQLPVMICQSNALAGHFEMYAGGVGFGPHKHQLADCFLNGVRTC